ncbi:MAG: 4-(cytidine 5'-diphospho)-2-C-methyl-D-erythritol kinase [Treponema sp.]|nr:4-(cytidine 5'-diphospho)-2-C-methyl-D-erythritol kinase [Treponema sp.]
MKEKTARVCGIQAPCKINLHLCIGEKRPDGFHDVASVFAALALSDTLRFERAGPQGVSVLDVNCRRPCGAIPPEDNLVLKAAALFRERTGFAGGLRIRLDKRVPVGAGLGGGSSNAASTLLALNALAGAPLSGNELTELSATLGSDVPFFLAGGAAFVSGRGEVVEPVKAPAGLWVVLVKPPFSSDTKTAYRLLDEAREHGCCREPGREQATHAPSKDVLIRSLEGGPGTWPFYNDFLPLFLREDGAEADAYRAILEGLRQAGASFAGLSGSGSCCFGVFVTEKMAKNAEKELKGAKNDVNLTFFLARKAKIVLEY